MKRGMFWLLNFVVYFVFSASEQALMTPDGYYWDEASQFADITIFIVGVVVLWNVYLRRCRDAGMKSAWNGAWCLVPLAIFWWGFVPTGYHAAKVEGQAI